MPERAFSISMLEGTNSALQAHLLRADQQEDLVFTLYRSVRGATRDAAILSEILLPEGGDRRVHGNASFGPSYVERIVSAARTRRCGIAFLHSHPGGVGWQGLSHDDDVAELRLARTALAATSLPLVGLTLAGRDGAWSARRWLKVGVRDYVRQDAENVRIVGRRLTVSLPPRPHERAEESTVRTASAWGVEAHRVLSSLRVGIVGLGSVGSIVAETAARIGIRDLVLVDHDVIKVLNLDRTLNALPTDVDHAKVDVAADHLRLILADRLRSILPIARRCDDEAAYAALLDCDIVFCCVDRPWGRRILNQLSYTNLIPVSNGGLLVRNRKGRLVGADWHVHLVGPARRCMQCWKAFDPAEAALDRDGLLDDQSYVKELDPDSPLIANANALPYSMGVASMQFSQVAAAVAGPIEDLGDWNFHATIGRCDIGCDVGCDPECPYAAMVGNPGAVPPLRT